MMHSQANVWDAEASPAPFTAYIGSVPDNGLLEQGTTPWTQQAQHYDASKQWTEPAMMPGSMAPHPIPSETFAGGAAGAMFNKGKNEFTTYGAAPATRKKQVKPPNIGLIILLLLLPCVIFALTFYLRSFHLRFSSNMVATFLSYCLILPALALAPMGLVLAAEKDVPLTMLVSLSCLVAWIAGLSCGDHNYQHYMFPYYNVNNLNTYESIDPLAFSGSQVMDAGKLHFSGGSVILTSLSGGFKNGNVYCVAPIGLSANATQTQKSYDFWAVGINCCSAHAPDFQCGEYSNPLAHWGLRVMDETDRSMFEIAVKQTAAAHNFHAHQPIFLHWLTDVDAEVQAYSDDGTQRFITSVFGYFGFQLFVVLLAAAMHPWM